MLLRDNARNPLQGRLDPAEVDAAIYGSRADGLSELGGRVVARPTPIGEIWADIRQPRRAVPGVVRGSWTGDPELVARLLAIWEQQAVEAVGQSIPTMNILMGNGDGLDVEALPAIAQEWVALARLAASIREEGLINPISIVQIDNRWLIESGERRWLAYHLLNSLGFEGFGAIPAIRVDGSDYVWRQARENTARRQLNAIGMARQFALLLMAARQEAGQGTYAPYEKCVPEGGCDRWYYAQVADGNIHRIPRGMGERIESAMGLGKMQISQYRDLLALTGDDLVDDAIWTRADMESWPERAMRDIKDRYTTVYLREVICRPGWQLEDLRPEKPQPITTANILGTTPTADSLPAGSLPPVSSPPLRTPISAARFKPGDMVEANGIISRIDQPQFQRGVPGFIVWQPNLQRFSWYAETALIPLGCTWKEWLASDGELKETPAISPGSAAVISDKSDSPTPAEEDGLIFDEGGLPRAVLNTLKILAWHTHNDAAKDAFFGIISMTRRQAAALAEKGELAGLLAQWSSVVSEAFGGWYEMVESYIQHIDEEGRQ